MDIKLQWHQPERLFVAMFMRDGQPWSLGGSVVGRHARPGEAVDALIRVATDLVIDGETSLTRGQISLDDRGWLFSLLDQGSEPEIREKMYMALRLAETVAATKRRAR
jgi:hypothetical protein